MVKYIGAIVASVIKSKKPSKNSTRIAGATHPIHAVTKEQHKKLLLTEGKCQCCGADEGECKGICDECRLS